MSLKSDGWWKWDAGLVTDFDKEWRTLRSAEDASVNFTRRTGDGGFIECRYVRRQAEYLIGYISSGSGCDQACRFCHLTATGQTMSTPVKCNDILRQARKVMLHYADGEPKAQHVNWNFMARGEPLLNQPMALDWSSIAEYLVLEAQENGLTASINFSTIMPEATKGIDLVEAYGGMPPAIYYSLYSLDPAFRKRWIPKGQDPREALRRLARYQARTGAAVVLHWALIDGVNDSASMAREIATLVKSLRLEAKFNLVRYNPPSPRQGREAEPEAIEAYFAEIAGILGHEGSRIVPRVGFDVKASCGMFVSE